MADQNDDPSTPSASYMAMLPYWQMVASIKGGAEAMRRLGFGSATYSSMSGPSQPVANLVDLQRGLGPTFPQSPYLPAFPNESWRDYEHRRKFAPFTNLYEDIADNLASKPFAKELTLDDNEPQDLQDLSEDIDGRGNSLHIFAKSTFRDGIDNGIDWILVDYTKVPAGVTLADERALNARPYWVKIEANDMLAVYSAFVGGKEIIYHARFCADVQVQDGYSEDTIERVRVLNREQVTDEYGNIIALGPATWELWEKQEDEKRNVQWVMIGTGPITIGIIPLVPFVPAERCDNFKAKPALRDIAYMQVEEFQQESNLKSVKEQAAFPMLAGNGVTPQMDTSGAQVTVPVGPKAVLFAPQAGDGKFGKWEYIEPAGESLKFLQSELEVFRREMRNLGRQPLADANLTVITTANVSMKAHSAVQAWALMLKDALEQAWILTCKWLNQDLSPVVKIHTDFSVDMTADTELTSLLAAETQGILSKRTVQDEFKRRGVLSDDFDPDAEEEQLANEQQGQQLQPERMIDPVTGQPIIVQPKPGVPNPPPPPKPPTIN